MMSSFRKVGLSEDSHLGKGGLGIAALPWEELERVSKGVEAKLSAML